MPPFSRSALPGGVAVDAFAGSDLSASSHALAQHCSNCAAALSSAAAVKANLAIFAAAAAMRRFLNTFLICHCAKEFIYGFSS